eukprot:TRINITY_DN32246_c0_g1_i1.p1 TRINITY_DN32246_c0_g1~~TRINITY_DN32246_c0_g1_i1.p1  ORF type:complete len:269 (+),score=62.25 TRINITY_DN32246_c0_g1_i1:59-865(+)
MQPTACAPANCSGIGACGATATPGGAAASAAKVLPGGPSLLGSDDAASCRTLESNCGQNSPSDPSLRSWDLVKESFSPSVLGNESLTCKVEQLASRRSLAGVFLGSVAGRSSSPSGKAAGLRGLKVASAGCSESQASDIDNMVLREVSKGEHEPKDSDDWYPVDSMELDAVLAQELGLTVLAGAAAAVPVLAGAACALASSEHSFGSNCRGAESAAAVAAMHSHQGAAKFIMSLGSFLNEEVPEFPFSKKEFCPSSREMMTSALPQVA